MDSLAELPPEIRRFAPWTWRSRWLLLAGLIVASLIAALSFVVLFGWVTIAVPPTTVIRSATPGAPE